MLKSTTTMIAIALLGIAIVPPLPAEQISTVDKNTRYLALGDSLAFGCDPTTFTSLSKCIGYAQLVADALHKKYANASCPGESSGSFLNTNAPDFGCQLWKTAGNRMFIRYSGSQMDYALLYLRSNPETKLVTINIGGNDLAVLQLGCNFDTSCIVAGVGSTLAQAALNLTAIYQKIRVDAAYSGPIIALTYYCFNYADPLQFQVFSALNSVIEGVSSAYGVKVANGFGAFQAVSAAYGGDSCAAGLLVRNGNGTCGTHPSATGDELLANTVLAAIDSK